MAEVDHLIANWITNNMLYIVIVILLLWFLIKNKTDLKHRWFAFFLHQFTKKRFLKLEEVKKDLFSGLGSIVSHDPQLRKKNAIKILEVGVGTGVNFSHYPDGTHLLAVDPNPHFSKYYNDNRSKFPNIHSSEILTCTGEEMDQIPDNSVDAVVITLVLCSTSNTEKIIQQILRVLVPGGQFYFLEHIREFDAESHSVRQKVQDFLSDSGLWPFLFDGCHLNRDPLAVIEGAGFARVQARRFYGPVPCFVAKVVESQLSGVATK